MEVFWRKFPFPTQVDSSQNGRHFVPQGRCDAYKVTTIVITIGVVGVIGWKHLSYSSSTTTGEQVT